MPSKPAGGAFCRALGCADLVILNKWDQVNERNTEVLATVTPWSEGGKTFGQISPQALLGLEASGG